MYLSKERSFLINTLVKEQDPSTTSLVYSGLAGQRNRIHMFTRFRSALPAPSILKLCDVMQIYDL